MSPEAQEAMVLENIVPQLQAEGFEVYSRPSASLLPPFLQACAPDAIALREDRKLAIEVVHKGSTSEGKLGKLRELLSHHGDWELRVYWISPSNTPKAVDVVSAKDIERAIGSIEELGEKGLFAPALLMSWATLEALGRTFEPDKLARPQTPGRLVEVLAGEGLVTPGEADRLRQLAAARNQLIHGGLKVRVTSKDIKPFVAVLRTLLDLLRTH